MSGARSSSSSSSNRGYPSEQKEHDTDKAKNEREYWDVIAFIEVGKDRKKKPRSAGYAWTSEDREYGRQIHVQVQMIPPPGNGWDGTFVIQKRREQDQKQDPDPQREPQRDTQRRER